MVLTFFTVTGSTRSEPASIDRLRGLRARRANPCALHTGRQQGRRLGLVFGRNARLLCGGPLASGFAFVAVERRVAVPMLDLALLRNQVLVGARVAILIGAGTINGLMYLLSLYFQDPTLSGSHPFRLGWPLCPRPLVWS